jgi:putative ABC transport system substrate-binding protein
MRRREFITLVGGAAAAWPFAARAQQPALPVIGYLSGTVRSPSTIVDFREGLQEAGYVEGKNVTFEYRWSEGQNERLPALAADLVRRQVAVIVAVGGSYAALAAKAATSTIPIVFASGGDPVKLGLVASLNRPEGNLTGLTFLTAELADKRLDLLREVVPQAMTFAYLLDPRATPESDMLAAARAIGRQVIFVEARGEPDFEPAFATLVQRRVDALVVASNPLFTTSRDKILALAARHRIPAIYAFREFAADGGLMSYGASLAGAYRQAGAYVAQILKGAKPADLPIQQSTHFELVINLKTAKTLGLAVPLTVQASADEVIE